ncbi:MAG: helix-turn-helix transcriptional regulator [Ruminococcus sp.]|nr:helix-turn-helix transcriptional regulator [Ruminococcus sp.]
MANKNYFMNGITELLILSILDKHDSYVYEIVKSIADFSGGLLSISQNTIYTATYKLESEGKISEYSMRVGRKRTRVYYRIEPNGKDYLKQILESYKNTTDGVQKVIAVLAQKQGEEKTDE